MRTGARSVIAVPALVLAAAIAAAAQASDRSIPPNEERFISVQLPNVLLTTSTGQRVDLQSITAGRPLLLAFVFTRCAGVCSPFLMSWRAADQRLPPRAGVHRLVVSFDSRDSADDMAIAAHHLGADVDTSWTFAVAAPDDIRQLTAAVGFWYDWDASRQQFDHPAMLAAVRNGRVVRLMIGGTVTSARLDELTREATGEFVASYPLPGRTRFRCLQFDARTGRVSLDWGFALLLIPVGSVGLTTVIMFSAGARVRRRTD